MPEAPSFIKSYSKEHAQAERDALAKEIRDLRAGVDSPIDGSQYLVAQTEGVETNENIKALDKLRNWLLEAQEYLPAQVRAILSRSAGVPEVSLPKNAEIGVDMEAEKSNWRAEAEEAVQNFYNKQTEQWKNASYEAAEVEKYFDPAFLSTLSLEDYTLLLTRFPSQMMTHVTRQGVRDHIGGVFHLSGEGEHLDGFKQILESGELKNFMSLCVTEEAKREGIVKLLKFDELTKEEAVARLEDMCDVAKQRYEGGYSDRDSIHFAAEEVADAHYGAEKGNEIFIAYPSLFIASQFDFNGQLSEAKGGTHNNQMVFTEEGEGVPVGAGITFIPKNALVDSRTGSRYELDEANRPSKNEALAHKIQEIVGREGFADFASKYADLLGNNVKGSREWRDASATSTQELQQVFGVTEPELLSVINNHDFLLDAKSDQGISEAQIYTNLKRKGLYYRPADEVVTSEEYWSSYFAQNPEKQPSKVVYYEGVDPTQALNNWRAQNGLVKKDERSDMGFAQNQLDLTTENKRSEEVLRFKTLATSIIEEHYV